MAGEGEGVTPEDRAELDRLLWLRRYYLDSWLAAVARLDLARPATTQGAERSKEILALLATGEIRQEEALSLMLDEVRQWWQEFQATIPADRSVLN